MTAAWILYSLLASVLVAAAAHAAASAARIRRLPTRGVWIVALLATVLLSALAPVRGRPAASAPALEMSAAPTAQAITPVRPGVLDRLAAAPAQLSGAAVHALAAVGSTLPPRVDRGLAWTWFAASALLLTLLVAVQLRYASLRRGWPTAEIAGRRVRVAPDTGPAVIGTARPEIVVPAWLLDRSAREQSLVLEHEAEHVRGGDPLLLALGCATVALLPWNPAAWWMLGRLRLAVELDCDARVLRHGVAPRAYGSLLIDLAGRSAGFPAAAAALADTPSHLERRLVAMRPDRIRFPLLRAAAGSALALVAILAACEAKMPTDADVRAMDVAAAERGATQLRMRTPADSLTTYTIDGRAATAAEAHALPPLRIAAMKVSKTTDSTGVLRHAEIAITTRSEAEAAQLASRGQGKAGVVRMRAASHANTFTGLILIDGKRADNAAMQALAPEDIRSVEVLKGDAAMKAYAEPEARNGVIRITTGKGQGS